jgi:hypothetical protein
MNGKRIGGIICLLLAGGLFLAAINSLQGSGGSGPWISRLVGAFLPSLLALIVGLWLIQQRGRGPGDDPPQAPRRGFRDD